MPSVTIEVFRRIGAQGLCRLAPPHWEHFCRGLAPLTSDAEPAPRRIDLLVLTLRDGRCELIEPLSVALDENGYIDRPDLELRPLPEARRVLDARAIFLNRYLRHAHRWHPEPAMIERALRLAQPAREPER